MQVWNLRCCLAATMLFAGGCEQASTLNTDTPPTPPVVDTLDENATEDSDTSPVDDEVAATTIAADPDALSPGVEIGKTIPEFAMLDQTGTERSLENLIDDDHKYLALVFYRSADW